MLRYVVAVEQNADMVWNMNISTPQVACNFRYINQHRCQLKKMEMGRTYPTNGQEQQM